MLEAVSALSQVVLFSILYMIALAGIASRFQEPSPWAENLAAAPGDCHEAVRMDFFATANPILIDTPAAVFRHVASRLKGPAEYLILLLLDSSNGLRGEIVCTDQATGYVRVPPLEQVVKYCGQSRASRVIVAHNHPLGTMYPSLEDVHYTASLSARLADQGITLADHLIITASGYHSIRDYGKSHWLIPGLD